MDTEAVQPQEASLTVNEQVIVMSSHETIRVLEVGVDTPLPAEEDRKPLEMPPGEVARSSPGKTGHPGREEVPPSTQSSCSGEAAGKAKPAARASPSTVPSVGTFSHATSQQPQTLAPLAVQATPQYCRSSGRSAGAGCVDISYSNGRCPSRIDGCFSYRGNFQTAYSQFASRCRAEHSHPSAGAACPAAAGCGPAPAPPPDPWRLPHRTRPAPHPATARCSTHAARGQAVRDADPDHRPTCWICL
uniref:POU class 6 homeobox 1 n=1 Tax=Accipiter nisus TaxID=211598 RepID=A0A8B9MX22_9AVES